MNNELTIRKATTADRTKIQEIIDLSFPFFRLFASHSLDSEEGKVLLTETQGVISGFAKLIEFNVDRDKYGCILWLAVHPSQRRKGFAVALVNAGYEYLTLNGAQEVFASVQRRNRASLATFRKEGFMQVGFLSLRQHFGWRIFRFYSSIWYAPGEIVLVKHLQK